MKNQFAKLCLVVALTFGSAHLALSADFDKGVAAWEGGDYETALHEWTPLAEQGDASAQYNLGALYFNGQGVTQDYAAALKWFTLAAEQGDASAQFILGVMYDNGKGVTQDYAAALKWYTLAAEQGSNESQAALSILYYEGKGVIQDYKSAHMWANIAASSGDDLARQLRDFFAVEMTPSQIEAAQQLARECVQKDFKGC